ncbi:MAG: hypothetical protein ACOC80_09215 [Petrotogales bacterium]
MSEIEEFLNDIEEDVRKRVSALAEDVHEKLGLPKEEVLQEYEETMKHLSDVLETDNKKTIQRRAWARVRGDWHRQLRSDAKMFNGVVVGASSPFDMSRQMYQQAKEEYRKNPEEAIKKGFVNDDGEPLDWQGKFVPKGDVLPEHNWIRNVVGICKPIEADEVEVFKMTLNGKQAKELQIPTFKPVRFRANISDRQGIGFKWLNPWSGLQFRVVEDVDFNMNDVFESSVLNDMWISLDEIPEWTETHQGTYNEIFITEGDVSFIADAPNPKTGNLRMVIDSDEIGMDSYTVWIPEELVDEVDFGRGSSVVVSGRANQTMFNDEVDYMINAWGLYAYPELKIPRDEVASEVIQSFDSIQ